MNKTLFTRRALFRGFLAAPMVNRGRFRVFAQDFKQYSKRTLDLMQRTLVIDMLSPLGMVEGRGERWFKSPGGFTADDFSWVRSSGTNIFHVAANIVGSDAHGQALQYFSRLNTLVARHEEYFTRCDGREELEQLSDSGKVGLIFGVQNSEHFRSGADVDLFWKLGQRVSQLTNNNRNRIGSGAMEREDDGLTTFGVELVDRMNRVGMTIDVSHCGDRTTLDSFEASSKPVAISHSNCRALNPGYPRCKTDEAIKSMAAKGGVMGLTVLRGFVRGKDPTTIQDFLDHVDHIARLVGIQHVGIGSDADLESSGAAGMQMYDKLPPEIRNFYRFRKSIEIPGLDHPRRMFDIAEGLVGRGYSDAEIQGVLGLNFQRLLAASWATSSLPSSLHAPKDAAVPGGDSEDRNFLLGLTPVGPATPETW